MRLPFPKNLTRISFCSSTRGRAAACIAHGASGPGNIADLQVFVARYRDLRISESHIISAGNFRNGASKIVNRDLPLCAAA